MKRASRAWRALRGEMAPRADPRGQSPIRHRALAAVPTLVPRSSRTPILPDPIIQARGGGVLANPYAASSIDTTGCRLNVLSAAISCDGATTTRCSSAVRFSSVNTGTAETARYGRRPGCYRLTVSQTEQGDETCKKARGQVR